MAAKHSSTRSRKISPNPGFWSSYHSWAFFTSRFAGGSRMGHLLFAIDNLALYLVPGLARLRICTLRFDAPLQLLHLPIGNGNAFWLPRHAIPEGGYELKFLLHAQAHCLFHDVSHFCFLKES